MICGERVRTSIDSETCNSGIPESEGPGDNSNAAGVVIIIVFLTEVAAPVESVDIFAATNEWHWVAGADSRMANGREEDVEMTIV